MKPRISLITLGVDDLEISLRFYRDGLGLATQGIIGTEKSEVDQVMEQAKNAGAVIVKPAQDTIWGGQAAVMPQSEMGHCGFQANALQAALLTRRSIIVLTSKKEEHEAHESEDRYQERNRCRYQRNNRGDCRRV